MHESMKRLYDVVRQQSPLEKHLQAAVARAMNQSQQTVKNWEKRGISKEGALLAQEIWGCDANELRGQPTPFKLPERQNLTSIAQESDIDRPYLWPFTLVTRPQWLMLDDDEREDVERMAKRLITSKQSAPAKKLKAAG